MSTDSAGIQPEMDEEERKFRAWRAQEKMRAAKNPPRSAPPWAPAPFEREGDQVAQDRWLFICLAACVGAIVLVAIAVGPPSSEASSAAMGGLCSLIGFGLALGLCAMVGRWIGQQKGRETEGLVLGLLLGPLGWIIAALLPETIEAAAQRQIEIERRVADFRGDARQRDPEVAAQAAADDVRWRALMGQIEARGGGQDARPTQNPPLDKPAGS